MARPLAITPEKQERILDALREGNTRAVAASVGGVTYECFRMHNGRSPEFAAAVIDAESAAEQKAVEHVRNAMGDTWTAAAWWLERRRPRVYGKQERLTVLRDVARDISQMSDEEVEALAYGDGDEGEAAAAGG